MDVLEQGSDSRGFFSRPPGKALIAVLAVVALVVAGVSEFQRRDRQAAPVPAPSVRPSFEATKVNWSNGQSYSATLANETRDFVLRFDLQNHNAATVSVRGMEQPADPAYARLVVAVMAGSGVGPSPTYEEVEAAADQPLPLDFESIAQLTVAGRLRCTPRPALRNWLQFLVEDERNVVGLPEFDGDKWTVYVAKELCR